MYGRLVLRIGGKWGLVVAVGVAMSSGSFAFAEEQETEREPASVPAPRTTEAKVGEVVFNFSGFAWFEVESVNNFGYGTTTGTADFKSSAQTASNFFANLQFTAERGPTKLTSIFEIGEMIDGDNASGGAQGGRQKVTEVRNLYLTHKLDDTWSIRGGLLPVLSDPQAFILADHYLAEALDYSKDVTSFSLWHAKANADRPGVNSSSTDHVNPDQYVGFLGTTEFGPTKTALYGVYRKTIETLYDSAAAATTKGNSTYSWLGLTIDHKIGSASLFQASYIHNSGHFEADLGGPKDDMNSFLVDLEFKTTTDSGTEFDIDGLMTSGSSDGTATGQSVQTIGKRQSFASPDPGAAYLLSIATSDGADEAAGAAKQNIIGSLAQSNGLKLVVFKVTQTFNDRFNAFARVGVLRSTSENTATGSDDMGTEVDIGTTYEISPGTTWQIEGGQLTPGNYYADREPAVLATTRLRFGF